MATFKIIKNGEEITPKQALKLLPIGGYDPWGRYNEKSDAYVADSLEKLKKDFLIDSYEIEGEIEMPPYVEGRVY